MRKTAIQFYTFVGNPRCVAQFTKRSFRLNDFGFFARLAGLESRRIQTTSPPWLLLWYIWNIAVVKKNWASNSSCYVSSTSPSAFVNKIALQDVMKKRLVQKESENEPASDRSFVVSHSKQHHWLMRLSFLVTVGVSSSTGAFSSVGFSFAT